MQQPEGKSSDANRVARCQQLQQQQSLTGRRRRDEIIVRCVIRKRLVELQLSTTTK